VNVRSISVAELRAAAMAWRQHDIRQPRHRLWSWLIPEPNMSLHDRIDELIDEVERLRVTGAP
jgi:hypothetical protein